MSGIEWLSQGAEQLFMEIEDLGSSKPHFDIAIVGSGYGGAVAAARLAGLVNENNELLKVCVLERGREFVPGSFPEKFSELPGLFRLQGDKLAEPRGMRDGLFDFRLGSNVSALLGSGLGGGSLINAGVLVQPDDTFMAKKSWPTPLHKANLASCFNDARDMLGASQVPDPALSKLVALDAIARELGDGTNDRRANIAVSFSDGENKSGVMQKKCINCGDCFTGCNHGAKNTLAMNYLPLAGRRGARLFTGVTVLDVKPGKDGKHWALRLELTDPDTQKRLNQSKLDKSQRGKPGTLPAVSSIRLLARRVILAAGTFGSTEILMRSRSDTFQFSKKLGEGFSTNGDMIAVGYKTKLEVNASADPALAPKDRLVGPTIAGIIDFRASQDPEKSGIVIEELAIPAALRRLFEETITTFGGLHGLIRRERSDHSPEQAGPDPAGINQQAVKSTAVYATMGDDGAKGRLELLHSSEGGRPGDSGLRVVWENVGKENVFERAMRLLHKAHASDSIGGTVVPYPAWRALPDQIESVFGNPAGKGAVFTVHPLGGCSMADSHKEGVVNHIGQVFNPASGSLHDGLVVLDGSTIPCSLGINPCLTITALAEYAVKHLRKEWSLIDPVDDPLQTLPVPPEIDIPYKPPHSTSIRIAERMKAKVLQVPLQNGRSIAAKGELELEFDEIKDLPDLIANLPKRIAIKKGLLCVTVPKLSEATKPLKPLEATVALAGSMSFLEREASTSGQRIRRALWAWALNRGIREVWIAAAYKLRSAWLWVRSRRARGYMKFLMRNRPAISIGDKIRALIDLASHVGEVRRFEYFLRTQADLFIDGHLLMPAGTRLFGEKRLAYTFLGNPWLQLSRLKLEMELPNSSTRVEIGTMELDPMHFVKEHAVQLQLLSQETQPDAIADLISFALFFIRLVGTIHFWTFRAPDYPRPYPSYASAPGDPPHVRRLPGPVRNAVRSEPVQVAVPATADLSFPIYVAGKIELITISIDLGKAMPIYLTRYQPRPSAAATVKREPVVLFHGYGAAGNTFAPGNRKASLVGSLVNAGFDVWVVDFRTSIALSSSLQNWIFEHIAYGDVHTAIEHVRKETNSAKVNVVAHCVGSAMFSMSVLGGRVPVDWINAVVLSQVGPIVEMPALNSARGYIAGYLKYLLKWKKLDVTSALTPFIRNIDRLLAAYPYPDHEQTVHHSIWPWRKFTHEAYCNRTHAIFGRLFEHKNLRTGMLDNLHTLLGNVNLQTFLQTTFYATRGRITDFLGRNVYVTYENVARSYCFPVCIVHGKLNEVFSISGTERSMRFLERVFGKHPDRLRVIPIPGYGHQDCLIGKNARRAVFPKIVKFLERNTDAPRLEPKPIERDVIRVPVLGPVLGWLRKDASRGKPASSHRVNIMFVPDDSRSPPMYAMTFVLTLPAGKVGPKPVKGFAKFHRLQTVSPRLASDVWRLHNTNEESTVVAQNIDVELPTDLEECLVLVLTAHKEPEGTSSGPRPGREVRYGNNETRLPETVKTGPFRPTEEESLVQGILEACNDLCTTATHLRGETRVIDEDYESMPGIAIISRDCLAAAGPSTAAEPSSTPDPEVTGDLVFATGSCRYAASIFDRELADLSFKRLVTLLSDPSEKQPVPQFLMLTGDQIYADATAGLFDPTTGLERFDRHYLEAWSTPGAREVLRRLPTYMMLDDHEVEENWERNASFERDGLSAFAQYQRKLAPVAPKFVQQPKPPFWYSFSSHGYGFFVADTRSERTRKAPQDRLDDKIFSQTQMEALRDWLQAQNQAKDRLRPKFIVSAGVLAPWTRGSMGSSAFALHEDSWAGFPTSMNWLLATIASNDIQNVIFLSGDYHSSMICELSVTAVKKGTTAKVYSIVSSGFYAPFPFANMPGYEIQQDYNGTQHAWIGKPKDCPKQWADLNINYSTRSLSHEDGFAIIRVAPAGNNGRHSIIIEFHTAQSVTTSTLPL